MNLEARDPTQTGTTAPSSSTTVIVCSVGTVFIEREWRWRRWALEVGGIGGSFEVDADDDDGLA